MASTNMTKKSTPVYTHEGARASKVNYLEQLNRAVCSCLLWEDNFYESGVSVAERIHDLMLKVKNEDCIEVMRKAKNDYHLRHIPLYMATILAEKKALTKELVYELVTRVDDITEMISLYWKDGKKPLPKQMQKGLANSFDKFDEYQFGKYKGTHKAISLKDAVMITHPKAKDELGNALYKKIVDNSLAIPVTWETELSAGKDKKATFEMLLTPDEKGRIKIGNLALLRNLRNMKDSGVDLKKVSVGISKMKATGVMPYNFYSANKYSDGLFQDQLESKMFEVLDQNYEKLNGLTLFMVDISGSMSSTLSGKGDVSRSEAAGSLAASLKRICEYSAIYTFNNTAHKATSSGFSLIEKCNRPSGGTDIFGSLDAALRDLGRTPDRIIILTDEQDGGGWYGYGRTPKDENSYKSLACTKYMINVAPYQYGVDYQNFIHINGFSDGVIKYIAEIEKLNNM